MKLMTALMGMVLVAGQVLAAPLDTATAAKQVEGYFNGMSTYQARFQQRTTGEQWTQEGMFYLNRPKGQFLWNYESPDRQRLIATGTKLYFVNDERGGAVTELPVKSGLSRLFTGKALNLEQEGLRVVKADQTDDQLVVTMEAKPVKGGTDMGGVETVTLTFARKPQLALMQADVVDAVDALTKVSFADVKQGLTMDGKMFQFTPKLKQM